MGADRRVIDANVFSDAGKMETLNTFARAFKEALGRPVMVTAYLHNKLHANHVWLEAPWVDGTVAVQEYALWRGLGILVIWREGRIVPCNEREQPQVRSIA